MTVELSEQLRRFADLADPITMDELRKQDRAVPSSWVSIRHPVASHRDRFLVAAAVVVVVGSATALVAPLVTSSSRPRIGGPRTLGSSAMGLVADSTAMALSLGTAEMDVTSSLKTAPSLTVGVHGDFLWGDVDENLLWTSGGHRTGSWTGITHDSLRIFERSTGLPTDCSMDSGQNNPGRMPVVS